LANVLDHLLDAPKWFNKSLAFFLKQDLGGLWSKFEQLVNFSTGKFNAKISDLIDFL